MVQSCSTGVRDGGKKDLTVGEIWGALNFYSEG